jgi:excisionase family DNA binding protein
MAVGRNRDWVSIARAGELLAASRKTVQRLIDTGRIGTRLIPGTRPLLSRHDVERLAEQSTRPATVAPLQEAANHG